MKLQMNLELTPEQKEGFKSFLKSPFIYQHFRHDCGYKGNSYHEVEGKWVFWTHCPQCNKELKVIPLGDVIIPMVEKACGPGWKMPVMECHEHRTTKDGREIEIINTVYPDKT